MNPSLPERFRQVRQLREARSTRLVRAELDGREVLVRISLDAADSEVLAELDVLSGVQHAGLAELLEYGKLDSGQWFVVRPWIDGSSLEELKGQCSFAELASIVARICPALAALHAHGFIHGDLRAENIVVRPNGEPVLVDYGFAHRFEEQAIEEVQGSWYFLAPETILTNRADSRSDMFALGVLLYSLMGYELPAPREFYARFPSEPFLTAAGTQSDALPAELRDLCVNLLSRNPETRPQGADWVGHALANRLGIELEAVEPGHHSGLSMSSLVGRDAWSRELRKATAQTIRWSRPPIKEDLEQLATSLRLSATLQGVSTHWVDLARELSSLDNSAKIDAFCQDLIQRARDHWLLLTADQLDPVLVRVLQALCVPSQPASLDRGVSLLCPSAPPEGLLVELVSFPASEESEWSLALAPHIPETSEADRRAFVSRLLELSDGAVSEANLLLARAIEHGLVLRGTDGLRLGLDAAERVVQLGIESGAGFEDDEAASGILEVLHLRQGPVSLAELSEIIGEGTRQAARDLQQACFVESLSVDGRVHIRLTNSGARLPVQIRPETHAQEAKRLKAASATPLAVVEQRWLAGDRAAESDLCVELQSLRERGAAEIALRTLVELRRNRELGVPLLAELALVWIALGQTDRAQSLTTDIESLAESARDRAALERLRAELAWSRNQFEAALQAYDRARETEPDDGGRSLAGKASLFFASGKNEELDSLAEEARKLSKSALQDRFRRNISMLHAMSQFRRGQVDSARTQLETFLDEALRASDPNYEAVCRINLGTVARRTGDLLHAIKQFRAAAVAFESAGVLKSIAQSSALLGGTLREAGRLLEAGQYLNRALEIRERLGDRVGAAVVRGMLGLLASDRFEVRNGLEELALSAESLERVQRHDDALLLRARADELSARAGVHYEFQDTGRSKSAPEDFEGDPRVLTAHGRVAWIQGEPRAAKMYLRCAVALAVELGRDAAIVEARTILRVLEDAHTREDAFHTSVDDSNPLIAQDDQCFSILAKEKSQFGATRAHSLALELEQCGRIDRAARMHLAVAARSNDESLRVGSLEASKKLLEQISRGLTDKESLACRMHLLGIPDPWPQDLDAGNRTDERRVDLDLSMFLEISNRMVAQQDLRTLLGTIVDSALKVTGGTRGFLVLQERGQLSFDTAFDSRRGDIERPEVEISESVIKQALEVMQPLRLSNASEDPQLAGAPSVNSLELRSILCCPFAVDEDTLGVIYVDNRMRSDVFGPRAELLLDHLGALAALSIRQVRRLEQIRELNERLTQKIAITETQLDAARISLREVGAAEPVSGMVGNSTAMRGVQKLLRQAAQSDLAVLVYGASGTGKELAARALHELSPRRDGPFVSENCAAIPETLIEAELFGYKRGAFTGADHDRIGMFERAHGGTIFLDEIGELPLEMQAKLLRVLESGEVRMLGDSRVRTTNFRLVTATNKNLEELVREGSFRVDLLYRLDALRVDLPTLAERVEDIPLLSEHFLRIQNTVDRTERKISKSVMRALCLRHWPGNVRELSNEISRLCVLSEGDLVDPDLIRAPHDPGTTVAGGVRTLEQIERQAIENALVATGGDKRKAAELLGISQSKIYQRLATWRDAGEE